MQKRSNIGATECGVGLKGSGSMTFHRREEAGKDELEGLLHVPCKCGGRKPC